MQDSTPSLSKLEIAQRQLERAICLFVDESDYICAITLAGASEEILGKLLEQQGMQPALANFVEACLKMGRHIYKEDWAKKDFVAMENHFRDGLKHITDGEPLSVPREAAIEILDRTIENYWRLTGHESASVRRYMVVAHAGA